MVPQHVSVPQVTKVQLDGRPRGSQQQRADAASLGRRLAIQIYDIVNDDKPQKVIAVVMLRSLSQSVVKNRPDA